MVINHSEYIKYRLTPILTSDERYHYYSCYQPNTLIHSTELIQFMLGVLLHIIVLCRYL